MDVYLLGAGASFADGVPLQGNLLKDIFESDDDVINYIDNARDALQFIESSFFTRNDFYPTFEQVFSFIDYYIRNRRSADSSLPITKLVSIRKALTNLIHHSIARNDKDNPENYIKFIEKLISKSQDFMIITMNYDILIDRAIIANKLKQLRISYAINSLDGGVNHIAHTEIIPLIKLHGSINWQYCDCCGMVVIKDNDSLIGTFGINTKEAQCKIDDTVLQPLLVTPSYEKDFAHSVISSLYNAAAYYLRKADTINIVGYSFPYADIHIYALLLRTVGKNTQIKIVNPTPSDSLIAYIRKISDMAGGKTTPAPELKYVKFETFDEWLW